MAEAKRATPLILLYHSIQASRLDAFGLRVPPKTFAQQMAWLRANAHPLSLADLHAAATAGAAPERGVAITFDDGYLNNLVHAKPAMEKHRVPGTVFVSSGYVGGEREYWWDELERIFMQAGTLPERLELEIAGERRAWDMNGRATLPRLKAWRAPRWYVWHDPVTPRHRALFEIWAAMHRTHDVEKREEALAQLRELVKLRSKPSRVGVCCTRDQLRALAQGELIEIGGHTINHPSLGYLPRAAQEREIQDSTATLEQIVQKPMRSFAYPFGSRSDYSEDTIAIVREAGYERAVSNFGGSLSAKTDPYQLPRRGISNWPIEEFAQRMNKWFTGE